MYELMDRAKIYDPDLCLQVLASCNWDINSAQNVLGTHSLTHLLYYLLTYSLTHSLLLADSGPSGAENMSSGNQSGLSQRRNVTSSINNSNDSSNSNQINNNSRR